MEYELCLSKLLSPCPPETLHSKDQQGEIVVLYTSLRQYIAVMLPLWARPSPLQPNLCLVPWLSLFL